MTKRPAILLLAPLLLLAGYRPAASAPSPPSVAVFGFSLDNTSPAPSTPEELARTAKIGTELSAALQQSGKYRVIGVSAAESPLKGQMDIEGCNGCERPVALKLGAQLAAYGWVQKVSNLILNLNLVIENAQTGRMVAGGSVDIRGNTDESWDRGLSFLLQEHVFRQ